MPQRRDGARRSRSWSGYATRRRVCTASRNATASSSKGRPSIATDSYEVKQGVLACKPGAGGYLFTDQTYDDFVVRFEFRLPPGGNNGLAIRAPLEGNPAFEGMEIQVTVTVNGTCVLDVDLDELKPLDGREHPGRTRTAGHIGLLGHGDPVEFRNIRVKTL